MTNPQDPAHSPTLWLEDSFGGETLAEFNLGTSASVTFDRPTRQERIERAAWRVIHVAVEHPQQARTLMVPRHLMDALYEALQP